MIKLNLLFPYINQILHIWNFSISLREDDYFLDRELLENLMREKNAFNSPFDCSFSSLPPSYLQLPSPADSASTMWVLWTSAISFMCNCSHQLSLDDCNCNIMNLLVPNYSLLLPPYRARKLVFLHHQFTQSPVKTIFTWHSRPFINWYRWISWFYFSPHLSTYRCSRTNWAPVIP